MSEERADGLSRSPYGDRDPGILPAVLTIASFLVFFVFRSLDDNRLVSWQWVFQKGSPVAVFSLLTAGCVFVLIVNRFLPRGIFSGSAPGRACREPSGRLLPDLLRSRGAVPCLVFTLSFLAGAVFWGIPEVIVDASRYFTQAKYLELNGARYFLREWGGEIAPWTDMPLIPFIYGLIFRYFGESRLGIQVVTTTLFSLTAVLTYMTGRTLWDEETGVQGAAFLLCVPYLLTQVPLMLVDVPAMFLLMLSIFTFIKAMRGGGIWLACSSSSIVLTFFSKYSAWLMLSVLVVVFLVHAASTEGPGAGTCTRRALLVVSGACLLIGLALFFRYPVLAEQIRFLMSYQRPGLKRWGESLLSSFFFQTHPFATVLAVYSVFVAVRKRDWKYAILVWLLLLVVLLQIRRIRYTIMVFPLFALMASYGMRELKNRGFGRLLLSCAVVSSLVIAVFAYRPFLQGLSMANLRDAGAFLNTRHASSVEVHVIQPENHAGNLIVAVPIIDLFTRKTIIHHAGRQAPGGQEIEKSPLRFTWEFRNPPYYERPEGGSEPDLAAVVSDEKDTLLPPDLAARLAGFQHLRTFGIDEGLFQLRTCVRIYEKRRT